MTTIGSFEPQEIDLDLLDNKMIFDLSIMLDEIYRGRIPDSFWKKHMQIDINSDTKTIWLSNSEGRQCLIHEGRIKEHFVCSSCDEEGFFNDNFDCENYICEDCQRKGQTTCE